MLVPPSRTVKATCGRGSRLTITDARNRSSGDPPHGWSVLRVARATTRHAAPTPALATRTALRYPYRLPTTEATTETTTTTTTEGSTPGFGVVVAVLALLGAVLLYRRR